MPETFNNSLVYLDYAATAPLLPAAALAMKEFLAAGENGFADANANSLHTPGRQAFSHLQHARQNIAECLHMRGNEVVFCSGATEANNMVLLGSVLLYKRNNPSAQPPHIVVSSVEHDAVYMCAKNIEACGLARVSYVAPLPSGHIDPTAVQQALCKDTILVSVILVNNEYGALNNISEIAAVAHKGGALFHTDAVQALGKMKLDMAAWGVDAASFSAHKIGGPKGVGMLYVRSGTALYPLLSGGGQELGRRSGTQNVCGAVGFAAAVDACCSDSAIEAQYSRLCNLRNKLYSSLSSYSFVHASVPCLDMPSQYAPHIVNVCVEGFESETLILQFDMAGIAVSGGSACSSHSLEPSRSLTQLGIAKDLALGSLRISLGTATTEEHIQQFLRVFDSITASNVL